MTPFRCHMLNRLDTILSSRLLGSDPVGEVQEPDVMDGPAKEERGVLGDLDKVRHGSPRRERGEEARAQRDLLHHLDVHLDSVPALKFRKLRQVDVGMKLRVRHEDQVRPRGFT